jgi:hypothetical protein
MGRPPAHVRMARLAATVAPLAIYLAASCLFAESDRATRLGALADTAASSSARHAPKDEDRAATVDRRSRSLASKPLLEALHCGNIGLRRLCSKVVRSGLPTVLKGRSFAAQFAPGLCSLGELQSSRPAERSFYLLFCTWLV